MSAMSCINRFCMVPEKAEIETFNGFFWGIRKNRNKAYLNV